MAEGGRVRTPQPREKLPSAVSGYCYHWQWSHTHSGLLRRDSVPWRSTLRTGLRLVDFLRRLDWRIAGLLLVLVVFFYWKILFTRQVMLPWDAGDFFYPYLAY